MRTVTAGLTRLALAAEQAQSPFRTLVAALALAAGIREDVFARGSFLEGLLGFSPGAIVGSERNFFPDAQDALRTGEPNRIVDTLRYEKGMSDKDIALLVGNRDTGLFDSLMNGVKSVMGGQSFRGLVGEDIVSSIAAGISPITGGPLKYGKGRGVFYWIGTKTPSKISLQGVRSVVFKESKNRALDIIRGTREEVKYPVSLDAPIGGDDPMSPGSLSLSQTLADPDSVGRANFVDLAAAIYQDPWVMGIIDREVRSELTTPQQEAVWQAIRQDPSMLNITPQGIGTSNQDLAKAVAKITGVPYSRSLEVSSGKTFREKVQPAMVSALGDSEIAKKLLRKRHILEVVQESARRPSSTREHIGPIPISGIEPSRSGPVRDVDLSEYVPDEPRVSPKFLQKLKSDPDLSAIWRLQQQGIRFARMRARVAARHWATQDKASWQLPPRQRVLYKQLKDWAMSNWEGFQKPNGKLDTDGLAHALALRAGDPTLDDDPTHWVYEIAYDVDRLARAW